MTTATMVPMGKVMVIAMVVGEVVQVWDAGGVAVMVVVAMVGAAGEVEEMIYTLMAVAHAVEIAKVEKAFTTMIQLGEVRCHLDQGILLTLWVSFSVLATTLDPTQNNFSYSDS
jgi:hypothetical protein